MFPIRLQRVIGKTPILCNDAYGGKVSYRPELECLLCFSKYGKLAYKDAIFCSPHKFIGGPGTTGILVAKKRVFRNPVPSVPGGGTVLYVTETTHQYLHQIHDKEEGGTPAIVDSIRTGLVFQLKDVSVLHFYAFKIQHSLSVRSFGGTGSFATTI